MFTNTVVEKLERGNVVIGCQVRTRSPMIAELYGYCGFDFVFIEGEHFPYDMESVLDVVRACDCVGIEPFLRIPCVDEGKILQSLDLGVKGMFFPHVDSGADAKRIMDAGKYAPEGNRGYSNTSRATEYGGLPMDAYKKQANKNTMMIPFVESKAAVERLEEILATGVDAIHIGPGDLSESFGQPINSGAVQGAMDYVVKTATKVGIPVAAPAATAEEAVSLIRRGFRIISFSSDLALLRSTCSKALGEIRSKL
jgi:4-hydroxy-2-oxoheptanedioate aldolase